MKFSKIGSHQDVAGFRYPATAILCCLLVCIHTIYGVKVISIPEKKWTLTKKMMASPKKVFNITCHYYQHLYPSPLTNCGFSQHPKSLDRPRTAGPSSVPPPQHCYRCCRHRKRRPDAKGGCDHGQSWGYPLVNIQKTMERSTIFNGKAHYKLPFSIAMLVYQRLPFNWVYVAACCAQNCKDPRQRVVYMRQEKLATQCGIPATSLTSVTSPCTAKKVK